MPETEDKSAHQLSFSQKGDMMYANVPTREQPVQKGKIMGLEGPEAIIHLNGSYFKRVHKSELFTPDEIALAAADLMPAGQPGEEVRLKDAIQEVLDNPVTAEELSTRLSVESLAKYVTAQRTLEEFGVQDGQKLLGDERKRGSNIWKVEELREGISKGFYPAGSSNELILARPAKDLEVLPAAEAAQIRAQIRETNRAMLDQLYERYSADFAKATVTDTKSHDMTVRRTVIPSLAGDFSFVETAYIDDGEVADATPPEVKTSEIISGTSEVPTRGN